MKSEALQFLAPRKRVKEMERRERQRKRWREESEMEKRKSLTLFSVSLRDYIIRVAEVNIH